METAPDGAAGLPRIGAGVALPVIMVLGLFEAGQVAALGSIALVLGGIVSLGSNVSTLRQTEAAIGVVVLNQMLAAGRPDSVRCMRVIA